MYPYFWRRLLNYWGWRRDTLVCMRQNNTYCWGADLGRMTAGKCDTCGAAIYFEQQNSVFKRKICHTCAQVEWEQQPTEKVTG